MNIDLVNCAVIDSQGDEPLPNASVSVSEGHIVAVDAGGVRNRSADALVVDLQGAYLLPGLWDCHAHLSMVFPQGDLTRHPVFEAQASRTLRAGRNAMDALQRGITSLRVVGDPHFLDVHWKQAFTSGEFLGPRLFVSGHGLRPTAGHGYANGTGLEVDGADEFRSATRDQIKHGADWVKVMVTGGVASQRETMHEPQTTFDEVAAVVQAAHQRGKKVAAHVGGPEGARIAVGAGVDSVEHGYLIDDETIAEMVAKGTYLVPTLSVTQDTEYIVRNWTPWAAKKGLDAAAGHLATFQKALRSGVKIASGTDLTPIAETTLGELEQLVRAGMSEAQAIAAATRDAAEMCGAADTVGTVQPGMLADLLAVDGNPLEDIRNLRRTRLVMKEGRIAVLRTPATSGTWSEMRCV